MVKHAFAFVLLAVASPIILKAQQIDNRLNITFGYHIFSFRGHTTISEGVFESPSLFSNFSRASGVSAKADYRIKKILSLGMCFTYFKASGWKMEKYAEYNGATASFNSLIPFLQLHTPFGESGWRNRFRVYLEGGPMVGLVNLKLAHPIFFTDSLNGQDGDIKTPDSGSNVYFGFKTSAGLQFAVNRFLGVYAGASHHTYHLKSVFYNDRKTSSMSFDVGVLWRLKREKHFYY
jgi:opacity protein-like surface antigen